MKNSKTHLFFRCNIKPLIQICSFMLRGLFHSAAWIPYSRIPPTIDVSPYVWILKMWDFIPSMFWQNVMIISCDGQNASNYRKPGSLVCHSNWQSRIIIWSQVQDLYWSGSKQYLWLSSSIRFSNSNADQLTAWTQRRIYCWTTYWEMSPGSHFD